MEGEEEKEQGSDEVESADQGADDAGGSSSGGRFYDCIFCKRGFSTAQALGGHMNIHRRDRARIRPAASSPSGARRVEDAARRASFHSEIAPALAVESSANYVVYFPGSSSATSGSREKRLREGGSQEVQSKRSKEMVEAGEELRLGLGRSGLRGPGEEGDDDSKGKGKEEEELEEGDLNFGLDLDLELRLGRSKKNGAGSSRRP
ncbi:hypothetical protein HPP92_014301 [Vanilla planifolia]|nr:hypothetical protein HPP92_014301 [Vanilla planifolia]